jgi:glycosyltransferase involved in cell wall biosynthesis
MNDQPLISIIIPVFNRFEWIPLTIQSLLDQTYSNFQAVFVNDGGESIQFLLDKYNDPRFLYFEHEKNLGLPSARNTGLKNCTGDYISFLDSDDIYMPLALEFRLSMLKKYNAEVVYTRALQNIYEKKNNQYSLVHQQLYWNSEFSRDQLLVMNICPCNCTLFSRKAWEDTGYWLDSELQSGEDYDFWIALSRKYDFINLKLIDCEDSYRTDTSSQMTGSRDFSKDLPRIFKRWRHTATPENLEWVIETQNNILRSRNLIPENFGL